MLRRLLPIGAILVTALISSCGGSDSEEKSAEPVTGDFMTTLPDGKLMTIHVFANKTGVFSSEFAVFSPTDPIKEGTCYGTIINGAIDAGCHEDGGNAFNVTGNPSPDGFVLYRSDDPDTKVTLTPIPADLKRVTAHGYRVLRVTLGGPGGSSDIAVLISLFNTGTFANYVGVWRGYDVALRSTIYGTGSSQTAITLDDHGHDRIYAYFNGSIQDPGFRSLTSTAQNYASTYGGTAMEVGVDPVVIANR